MSPDLLWRRPETKCYKVVTNVCWSQDLGRCCHYSYIFMRGPRINWKCKKKLWRTSCWNVPGRLVRTSPDLLYECPESKCYGESLALRPHTHTLVILPNLRRCTSEEKFKPLGGRFARGDFCPRSPTVRRRGRNLVTFLGSFWLPTIFWLPPTTTDRLICPNSL